MSKARKADDALVLALACGLSAEQAAKQAGVSPATVYRRLQEPAFQQRAEELRHEMLARAAAMLTAAGVESVRTLADLLKSSYAPTVRLNAASHRFSKARSAPKPPAPHRRTLPSSRSVPPARG